jgi:hypothetical protein
MLPATAQRNERTTWMWRPLTMSLSMFFAQQ